MLLFAVIGFVGLQGSAARAGSWTVNASADASINSRVPTQSNGGGGSLFTGIDGGLGKARSVIKFAVPLALQNKVTVTSVTVRLNYQKLPKNDPLDANYVGLPTPFVPVHAWLYLTRLTEDWVVGTHAGAAGGSLDSGVACTSGVTWNSRNCAGAAWTSAGGTVAGTTWGFPSSGPASSGANPLSWTYPGMTADVQTWIDNPAANYGYLLWSSTENNVAQALQRYYASETGFGPSLVINYTTCTTSANNACKNGIGGNTCVDPGGQSTTYLCSCGTGYTNTGGSTPSCIDTNACAVNHCTDGGDTGASVACHDELPPSTTYNCTCDTGYSAPAHGGTCQSACSGGMNPCGVGGTCTAVGAGGWTCSCGTGYTNTGGTTPMCIDTPGCDAGANAACMNGIGGNTCQDNIAPATGFHCSCGTGYATTSTATSGTCSNLNACAVDHCKDGGDTGPLVKCNDLAPPSTTYSCTCDSGSGFAFNGTTCVSSCTMTSNPCGPGSSSCVAAGSNWSCNCLAGYATTGGVQPSCAQIDACTATANNLCQTTQGNTCVDEAPPSSTYHCSCGAAYTGTNTTSCVDKNECIPNHCSDGGDTGALLQCQDKVAPQTGYLCMCDTGFNSNGTTCVSQCNGASNPCGPGGTCSVVGSGGWTCSCGSGYQTTGGIMPTCVNIDACDATAIANCTTYSNNGCVDEAPPSTTYHCSCGNPAFTTGTGGNGKPACVDKNECATNHCKDSGDNFASCTDRAAPLTGYDCVCASPTLWSQATVATFLTCVDVDECAAATNPCLNGTCTNLIGKGYSCACDAGFIEVEGNTPTPSCIHPSSCDANAAIACVSNQAGNACVDTPPPHIGYTCDCSNPGYVVSVDQRSCLDKNECATNHCVDEGDSRADCIDQTAPKPGYRCNCSVGYAFNEKSCVDVNECLSGSNPCGKGSCTNTEGSYQCACPTGYEVKLTPRPVCVLAGGASNYLSYSVQNGTCSIGGPNDGPVETAALVLMSLAVLAIARRRPARARR